MNKGLSSSLVAFRADELGDPLPKAWTPGGQGDVPKGKLMVHVVEDEFRAEIRSLLAD